MLAASGTGLWDWHIDENTAYYSDEWLAIVDMPPGVFEPRIEFRIGRIHPDDAAYVKSEFDAFLSGKGKGAPYIDFRMKRANGSWVHVRETVGITARDSNGRPTRLTGMMRDNTVAKTREKHLEDERRYHISVENMAGLMIWEWDIAADSITFSGRLKPFKEKSFKEFLEIVHPDDAPLYKQNLEEYLKRGEGNFEHILRFREANERYFWIMLHAVIVERDSLGRPAKVIGSTLDIDKNVRSEDALRASLEEIIRHRERLMANIERSEESLRSMFKNSPHACIMFDSGFHAIDCNPAALELFEFANEDEFRRDFAAFMDAAIPERQPDGRMSKPLSDRLNATVRDGTHEFETELILKGKPCPLSVIIKKVSYMDSFVLMLYAVDLRKQRDMLVSLRLRDRLLETINKMAVMLMRSNDDISAILRDAIAELGAGADVDAAYVLKNEDADGVLYCSVVSDWTRIGNQLPPSPPAPYDIIFPKWRDTLAEGKLYNYRMVDAVASADNNLLNILASMAKVKISLNIPLFIQDVFWGAIGFSRYDEGKPFIKAEEDLLQSAGILIAAAITRSKMTETLLEANRAAIVGVQAKTNFLSHMSHEIRTPINAIIGMTTLAQKAADMQRVRYCLTQIENSSRQLLGIINNVLDMSKIEANKLDLSTEEFVFEDMMRQIFDVVQVKIDEKGQKFQVHVDNTFTRAVISDELRLSQVFINLLANAIKFTPDGGRISLSVSQTPIDAGSARLHVVIADTGIGITDEQKARLFHLFEQAESSATTRKYGGTGLGLSIAKSIVNLMEGDIWIEDNPGGGSRFVFEVVIKWGKVCRRDKLPKQLRRDLRILVVDDDKDTREYFKGILAGFLLECDVASGGEEAVAMVERRKRDGKPYNLIFLDWMMPGMDGKRTAIEIKRIMGGVSLIVMISAANRSEVNSTLDALGITNFLPKPILPSTIYNTIVDLLGYTGETDSGDDGEMPSYDWSGKRMLLAEDVELNREVVMGILEDTGVTIECAENGSRAVELFAKNDYDVVLMDIQMPVMDGYDATRAIRASGKPNAAVCPVIAMTANAFKEDVRECLAAGMNDHIAKPLDVKRLFDTLSTYLSP
jgi:signal transduction histidine kinase/DNA-binding response OmpR family regulator/PAS domain-containing protein